MGLLILLCLISSQTGCSQLPRSEENNLQTLAGDDGCKLPCYRGITPEETTWEAAAKTLDEQAFSSEVFPEQQLIIWEEADGVKGHLSWSQDTVQSISLTYPESRLTLEQLLRITGKPDSLHITLPHPRRSPDPENPRCDILRLLFKDLDIEVIHYQRRTGSALPEHSVERISFSPDRPERAILTPFYKQDWDGYGFYCIAVEDIFP
jgi:hypothetical protein